MNDGAINLSGNLIKKKMSEYYFTDDKMSGKDRAREVMNRLKDSQDGRIKNVETIIKNKEGKPVPVSLSVSMLKDDDGKIKGTIGIAKDLREIKTMLEVGNSLLSSHEPDKILKIICNECLKLPKSKRAYIKLYNEESNFLYFRELSSTDSSDEMPKEPSPVDWGKSGFVFQNQEPYLSGDVTREPVQDFYQLFSDVRSKMVVPISSIDKKTDALKKWGVISVDSDKINAFTINDVHFLSAIDNQAAAALDNAELITSQKKVINELSALEIVRHAITESRDFNKILESVLDAVVTVLGFHYATISEVKHELDMVGALKGRNVPQKWLDLAWHRLQSDDIQAWVVRNRKEVKLTGWDERLDRKIYEEFEHEKLVRIFLPILARGDVLGTLETGHLKANKDDIEPEEIEILHRVVDLAGIGIEQVYLLNKQKNLLNQLQADLELRNELEKQLEALNQASLKLQNSRTEDEAVNHIFMCLESIGYDKAMLSLINEEEGIIEGKYALGKNWKKILKDTKRSLKGHDILAISLRKLEPILSKDCKADPRCDKHAVQRANIRSQYVIPLVVTDKGIGTLQIDLSDKPELVFGDKAVLDRCMNVLKTFAGQSAITISNIRDIGTIDFLETSLAETAHEFRSPLHNIITEIGGLKDYLECKYSRDEEEIEDIVTSISEQAQRAKRQMENTLLLSDKSKSSMGFNFEEGCIQHIIESCVLSYRLRALERGISIIVRDNIKRVPKFIFDKQKIEQVITNLIDNAVKYSDFNRKIQISGFDDGHYINLEIWDRGLGIPETEYENIFKGFTRSEIKDKTRYIPGTGIGLKISKQIIEAHGGAVRVRSIPIDGNYKKKNDYSSYDTKFVVVLPRKPKEK
jgi:PAS domain S-box-containing protein